jgi:polyisoprenoid-binding protein YceI
MKHLAWVLTALALSTAPTFAATPQWAVDHGKSKLGFMVQWSGEPFVATFKSWKADIAFDPNDLPHSHATVSIDLASETSGYDDNDQGLKGTQGFEASKYPTAKFQTTQITHGQGNSYVAQGTLALHGVTKPVTLNFNLTFSGKSAHMVGKSALQRGDFKLASGSFATDNPIARAVTVTIDLTATEP